MDLNIVVAAAVMLLISILVVRFVVRTAIFFLIAGMILFLLGFGVENMWKDVSTALPVGDSAEKAQGTDNKTTYPPLPTIPPNLRKPDGIMIGVPPRIVPFGKKKDNE